MNLPRRMGRAVAVSPCGAAAGGTGSAAGWWRGWERCRHKPDSPKPVCGVTQFLAEPHGRPWPPQPHEAPSPTAGAAAARGDRPTPRVAARSGAGGNAPAEVTPHVAVLCTGAAGAASGAAGGGCSTSLGLAARLWRDPRETSRAGESWSGPRWCSVTLAGVTMGIPLWRGVRGGCGAPPGCLRAVLSHPHILCCSQNQPIALTCPPSSASSEVPAKGLCSSSARPRVGAARTGHSPAMGTCPRL